ncbi:MAG: hypothetical protein QM761_05485 [Pseudoxanthomonas sp.]
MKIPTTLASMLVLLGYVALMRVDPGWGLLHPRGGLVVLAVSLAIANVGVWLATQPHRSPGTRFQLAAAGWIWIAAQGGGLAYLYVKSGAS